MFLDYLYVSFTNATAFSPTDTLPLTRWAKMLMLVQSAMSLSGSHGRRPRREHPEVTVQRRPHSGVVAQLSRAPTPFTPVVSSTS